MNIQQLSTEFILNAGGFANLTDDEGNGVYSIRADKVDHLADLLMQLTADIVATLIDAGSEREAVEENESLRAEITNELKGWTKE